MLESGSSGSVRGASSNGRPYRGPAPFCDIPGCRSWPPGSRAARWRNADRNHGCRRKAMDNRSP